MRRAPLASPAPRRARSASQKASSSLTPPIRSASATSERSVSPISPVSREPSSRAATERRRASSRSSSPHVKGQKRLELGLERRIRLVEQAAAEVLAEEADGCAKGGRPGGGEGANGAGGDAT